MIPINQTIFDNKFGNCYAACLASILEIPLDNVPFPDGNDNNFWTIYCNWFKSNNACIVTIQKNDFIPPESYLIGTVKSPRFENSDHAVVIFGGKIIHDPHPSKASLSDNLNDVTHIDFIFPIDPSKRMFRIEP